MAKLVFSTKNRDEAHAKLDELLGCKCVGIGTENYMQRLEEEKRANECPVHGDDEHRAEYHEYECHEDYNLDEPFEVWHVGPPRREEGDQ